MSAAMFFSPWSAGALRLPNRIVMAPLTRMRAAPGGVASQLMAEYYRQRAGAGLIVTEGTAVSAHGHGYPASPGIYTRAQIAAWKTVTDQVHEAGGRIVMQLQHNGRSSLSSYNDDGSLPVAPSSIVYIGKLYTPDFRPVDPETPRALEPADVSDLVDVFVEAARNAMAAGFDGVEIQAANGHLIDQFLCDGSNQRTDAYGGSIVNRCRFLLEIVDAMSEVVGVDRIGVRLSPFGRYGGISESDPIGLFHHAIEALSHRKIAYLHLIEATASEIGVSDQLHADAPNNLALFRRAFVGPLISAGGYRPETAAPVIERGATDAVAFGRLFIANPDLVKRMRLGLDLNAPDRTTFYGGDAHGYTDYPTWTPAEAVSVHA
jgi:N-ethylmaleimide reductase